jgi:hypothetical protein
VTERLLARVPLLLMLGVLVLAVKVLALDRDAAGRLVAALPLLLLSLAYAQAGRRGGGGGGPSARGGPSGRPGRGRARGAAEAG